MHLQFSDIHTVVVLTGLEVKPRARLVWDQDKTESKCSPDEDKIKTFKKWSQDQVLSIT